MLFQKRNLQKEMERQKCELCLLFGTCKVIDPIKNYLKDINKKVKTKIYSHFNDDVKRI